MEHIEGIFRGARDTKIYYQAYLPRAEIRASIIVVHGLGEHSGRYENVVNHLLPQGFAIYGFDHIGHGRSEGHRGFVHQYEDFSDTLTTYKNKVKSWQPGKPLFLLGHSMGGLIATEYLIDHSKELTGAVISAPLIKVPDNIGKFTIISGKILSMVAPKLGITALDPTAISRDPEVVEDYINDPFVFLGKTSARLSNELFKAIMRVNEEVDKIEIPFIVLQGSEDLLVNPNGSRMLYEGANSQDKTLKVYEGLYHEIFNEPERGRVLEDIANWLNARL